MPTKHPRVAITVPEDIKSAYARLSGITGVSLSKAMANVLIEAKPAIDSLCDVLEQQSNPSQKLAELAALSNEMNNDNQTDIVDRLEAEKRQK